MDCVATPVTPFPAFELGSIKDPYKCTLKIFIPFLQTWQAIPAVSVPCGFSSEGKPMGLQLLGPQKENVRVLQFAHLFEKKIGINNLPPLAE